VVNDKETLTKLLNMRTADDIENFLRQFPTEQEAQYIWVPVGGRMNNAGAIQVSKEPGPPIVERITNGIDAMLELSEVDQPTDLARPTTPRGASQLWYAIPDGRLSNANDVTLRELANNIAVTIYDCGKERALTFTICDKGIGQHPTDFANTLLSLGESNKISKRYLCGAYGQGGSSTFWWCKYTIIVSRRRPPHNQGRSDAIGWTIVRVMRDYARSKNPVYVYLVKKDSSTPTIDPSLLDELSFDYGTFVTHIEYEVGKSARHWASLWGYRLFENLLFDPILPFWLEDTGDRFRRVISGNAARLERNPSVEYSNRYLTCLDDKGQLMIKYWVLRVKTSAEPSEEKFYLDSFLDTPKSASSIVVTLNGQRHGALDKSFIRDEIKLGFLADYLLVQVECDGLSSRMKGEIFASLRGSVRESEEGMELIANKVRDALTTDPELQRLEQQRREQQLLNIDEEAERKIRKLLDRLISKTQAGLQPGLGTSHGTGIGNVPEQPPFKSSDPPTYLRFKTEEEPVEIVEASTREVALETDGPDELFTRSQNRGLLQINFAKNTGLSASIFGPLRNGHIWLKTTSSPNVAANTLDELECTLSMPNLDVPLKATREFLVIKPPDQFTPQDPPSVFRISSLSDPIPIKRGRKTSITIEIDAPDDILTRPESRACFEAQCSIPGVSVPDRRGPKDGRMQIFIETPSGTELDLLGWLECKLTLSNGSTLLDRKECKIVEPPPKAPTPTSTARKYRAPAYDIVQVAKEQWPAYGWDGSNVGKFVESQERLLLVVNLDHDELQKDLAKRNELGQNPNLVERIKRKYVLHLCYHLWLQYQNYKLSKSAGIPDDQRKLENESLSNSELQRVAKTILLLMHAERELT
jgi:hypothetical protein